MKLRETMIAWNPAPPSPWRRKDCGDEWVKAGPHGDGSGWHRAYSFTDGACYSIWHDETDQELLLRLFVLFATMTIRDGVPPLEVHQAFLEIEEYRRAVPSDFPRQGRLSPDTHPP